MRRVLHGWSTFCSSTRSTVIAVTHDRYFLDEVAGWILEIERGKTYPFEGNYSSWLESKQKRLDLGRQKDARRAKTLANELKWIQKSSGGESKTRHGSLVLKRCSARKLQSPLPTE